MLSLIINNSLHIPFQIWKSEFPLPYLTNLEYSLEKIASYSLLLLTIVYESVKNWVNKNSYHLLSNHYWPTPDIHFPLNPLIKDYFSYSLEDETKAQKVQIICPNSWRWDVAKARTPSFLSQGTFGFAHYSPCFLNGKYIQKQQ